MKTVKIPETSQPWSCSINGVTYTYPAGTEQSVPDEVAAIIEGAAEFPPAPDQVDKPFTALPEVTAEDNGDVLAVVDGAWAKSAPSAGGMVVNFVFNAETSSVTADKTVEEVTAAMLSSVVIGVVDLGDGQPRPLGTALMTESMNPAFVLADPNANKYFIDVDGEGEWHMNS